LFSSKTKFKVGDARKAYAIEHREPLLHFALCSGSYSDPAVHLYLAVFIIQICLPVKLLLLENICFSFGSFRINKPDVETNFSPYWYSRKSRGIRI
jgi:hypothetical protein